ncbi:MAG: hypothetical protein R2824_15755 [Saprospiraceae bacterium]|nr:hypothetical protein [Lewinella sp.]
MNHPILIGVALVALTAVSWWGLMKLEAIKPKKKSKRRRSKRKRKKKNRRRQVLKLLFHFSRREILFSGGLIALVTWLVAVTINDLPLTVISTVALVVIHFRFLAIKQQSNNHQ